MPSSTAILTYVAMPKVLLHDHLDGGLRPTTMLELAGEQGYDGLPADEPEALAAWIRRGANRRNLELYLETFVHTVGVMQTAEAIERVAYEAIVDLAADGVVHAELRYAPELSVNDALTMDDVVEAMTAGLARGERDTGCGARAILAALRHLDQSIPTAEAAVRWRDAGVVGFDLAGPEDGFPVVDHLDACRIAQEGDVAITLHAGEAFGPASIEQAIGIGGATRLGHGVRIIEDVVDGRPGPVAAEVIARRIPLEVCPTSNVHTGIADTLADHPLPGLVAAGFTVTLNTDNRLMSGVTPSSEFAAVAEAFGWGIADFHRVSVAAVDAAFLDDASKEVLRERVHDAYRSIAAADRDDD